MTQQELLTENKDLIIDCIYSKIYALEKKNRWNEKNCPDHLSIEHRKEKINKLAIILEGLENESN